MDVSPKTLREVEFREKMRGYHPEDVDQFLERVAASMEVLQDRLRQAMERTQRAEQAAAEAGGTDDTLRRTLVLAQRTADMAVQEAREQAARILAGAEQQAEGVLADAEERAQRAQYDALVETKTELGKLEASRQHLQAEVDGLAQWVQDHRAHLSLLLREALASVEQADLLSPPPASHGVDVAADAAPSGVTAPASEPGAADLPAPQADADGGPATQAWQMGVDAPVAGADDEASGTQAHGDGDPYFAELRRAVDQPEPLGPRATTIRPSRARVRTTAISCTTRLTAAAWAAGSAAATEPPPAPSLTSGSGLTHPQPHGPPVREPAFLPVLVGGRVLAGEDLEVDSQGLFGHPGPVGFDGDGHRGGDGQLEADAVGHLQTGVAPGLLHGPHHVAGQPFGFQDSAHLDVEDHQAVVAGQGPAGILGSGAESALELLGLEHRLADPGPAAVEELPVTPLGRGRHLRGERTQTGARPP